MRRGRIGRARLALGCAVACWPLRPRRRVGRARPCNGDPRLCDRALDQVVLPATHNSMSNAAGRLADPQPAGRHPGAAQRGRARLPDRHLLRARGANGTLVTDTAPTPASQLYLCHVACSIGADAAGRRAARHPPLPGATTRATCWCSSTRTTRGRRTSPARCGRSGLRRHVYGGTLGSRWPTLRKLIRRRRQVVMLSQGDTGAFRWYHNGYAGLLQETPYNWNTPDLLTEPAEVAGELPAQPRRHDRRPVPAQPLVAAGGAQPGHLGGRQRGRHAGGRARGLPLRARALADAGRGRHVPERRPVRGRAPAERRDRLGAPRRGEVNRVERVWVSRRDRRSRGEPGGPMRRSAAKPIHARSCPGCGDRSAA